VTQTAVQTVPRNGILGLMSETYGGLQVRHPVLL